MASSHWFATSYVKMDFPRLTFIVRKASRATRLVSPRKKVGPADRRRRAILAGIEFKSQVGSFGNNYNNRTEEAIGSATDIWAAYREGAFKPSARPWLGYMMLLEEAPGSMRPVKAQEPHFKVFPEFKKLPTPNATKSSSQS